MTDLVTLGAMTIPMSSTMDEKRIFVADTHRRWPLEDKLAMVAETRDDPCIAGCAQVWGGAGSAVPLAEDDG